MPQKKITKKTGTVRKKGRGVRVFFTLLIIVALGGTAFYFGWVQFQLDAGQYGVIYTKSHGWEENVLVNGEFEWRWQALLPTNLTLQIYEPMPRSTIIQRHGTLPSGEIYAEFVGDGVSFDWYIEAKVVYRIDPNALPTLAAENVGTPELVDLHAEYESRLSGLVNRILDGATAELDIQELEQKLKSGALEIDERFEVMSTAVLDWRYPDLELYDEARRSALALLKAREIVLTEVEEEAIRREDRQNSRIDSLARYGEVLSANPILLDFFALEGNPGAFLLPPAVSE